MLSIIITALLAGAAILVILILCFTITRIVKELVSLIKKEDGRTAVVFDKNEMEEILKGVKKENPEIEKSLKNKLKSSAKLAGIQNKKGDFVRFSSIKAKDDSDDEMKHGGVVSRTGEYEVFNKKGKVKDRGKINV